VAHRPIARFWLCNIDLWLFTLQRFSTTFYMLHTSSKFSYGLPFEVMFYFLSEHYATLQPWPLTFDLRSSSSVTHDVKNLSHKFGTFREFNSRVRAGAAHTDRRTNEHVAVGHASRPNNAPPQLESVAAVKASGCGVWSVIVIGKGDVRFGREARRDASSD